MRMFHSSVIVSLKNNTSDIIIILYANKLLQLLLGIYLLARVLINTYYQVQSA